MRKFTIIFFAVLILGVIAYNNYPSRISIPDNTNIDSIVVIKSKRQLLVFAKLQLIKTYNIALGHNPIGAKKYEGDSRTPEGIYIINDKNANSSFHKNLGVSYPNLKDIQEAKDLGQAPGGSIKIHGLRNGLGFIGKLHRLINWTNGCMALTNPEIDELFAHTPIGTPINIEK